MPTGNYYLPGNYLDHIRIRAKALTGQGYYFVQKVTVVTLTILDHVQI